MKHSCKILVKVCKNYFNILDYLILLVYLLDMKEIQWQKKAIKQLRRIKNSKTRVKIHTAVDTLKNFPNCQNVKKLVNIDNYRLRIGNWRVIFTADLKIIFIEEVKKRDEKTY